jgi:hypothetical protein
MHEAQLESASRAPLYRYLSAAFDKIGRHTAEREYTSGESQVQRPKENIMHSQSALKLLSRAAPADVNCRKNQQSKCNQI